MKNNAMAILLFVVGASTNHIAFCMQNQVIKSTGPLLEASGQLASMPNLCLPEVAACPLFELMSLISHSESLFEQSKRSRYTNVSPESSFKQVSAILEQVGAQKKMLPHGWKDTVALAFLYRDLHENKVPEKFPLALHDETREHYTTLAHKWLNDRFALEAIDEEDRKHVLLCSKMVEPHEALGISPHSLDYWREQIPKQQEGDPHEIIDTPAAQFFEQYYADNTSWHARVQALAQKQKDTGGSFKFLTWFVPPYKNNMRRVIGSSPYDPWYKYEDACGHTCMEPQSFFHSFGDNKRY